MGGDQSGLSKLLYVKELYLSVFVLFFRIGASNWSADVNEFKGAAGISVVECALAIIVYGWAQMFLGYHSVLNRWFMAVSFIAVYGINYYALVVRNVGIDFEKRFNTFSRGRQIFLYSVAIGIVLAIGILFYFSGIKHRAMLGAH